MKLARPALPASWQVLNPNEPLCVRLPPQKRGTAPVRLGFFAAATAWITFQTVLFQSGDWLPLVPYLLPFLFIEPVRGAGEYEEWRLSHRLIERVRKRGSRVIDSTRQEAATLELSTESGSCWLLCLKTGSEHELSFKSELLWEVLALAAYLHEHTSFEVEYPGGAGGTLRSLIEDSSPDLALDLQTLLQDPRGISVLAQARSMCGSEGKERVDRLFAPDGPGMPALATALNADDPVNLAAALELLGELDPDRALPLLRSGLAGSQQRVRIRAAEALGRLRDSAAVPALCAALEAGGELRLVSIRALAEIGDPMAVGPLCEALRNSPQPSERKARREIVLALGRFGDTTAVPALCEVLEDPVLPLRESAAAALGQLGDAAAAPALVRATLAAHNPSAPRAAATLALLRYPDVPGTVVEALLTVMKDGESTLRAAGAGALGKLGNADGIDPLPAALLDWDADVRREAAIALGSIAAVGLNAPLRLRGVIPQLRKMAAPMSAERPEVRSAARQALAKIEERTAAIKRMPLPAAAGEPSLNTLPVAASGPDAGG